MDLSIEELGDDDMTIVNTTWTADHLVERIYLFRVSMSDYVDQIDMWVTILAALK